MLSNQQTEDIQEIVVITRNVTNADGTTEVKNWY